MTLFKVNSGASLQITNAALNVPHIEPPPPPPDFYILSSSYDTETIFTGSAGSGSPRFGMSARVLGTAEGIYSLFGETYSDAVATEAGRAYLYLSNSLGIEATIISPADLSASDYFGEGLDMVSASNGIYVAIAAAGKDLPGKSAAGQVYLYLKDSGGMNLVDTLTGSIAFSDFGCGINGPGPGFNAATQGVALALGGNNNLYMGIYDNISSDKGSISLFESSSGGVSLLDQIVMETPVNYEKAWLGIDMISASDGLHIVGGTDGYYEPGATNNVGRGLYAHWTSAGNYITASMIPDVPLSASDQFGKCNPSLVNGAEGIYMMMGGVVTDFGTTSPRPGRGYLFLSNSLGITQQSEFTSSDTVTVAQYFGATEKILSGSDQPLMIFVTAENQQFPGAGANPGSVNIYQTSSNISTWNYLTGTTANEGFARGMDVTRYENSIYIVAGAPGYDIPAADVGRGYLYKWDLVVSGS